MRANYSKFMTKKLSNAVLLRTKLRNQLFEKGHEKLNQNTTSKYIYVSARLEKLKGIITKTLT